MFYSCYDYRKQVYRYYEAPGVLPAAGSFRATASDRTFPESLAVKLPAGAVSAGQGPMPKGVIAVDDSRALAAFEVPGPLSVNRWYIPAVLTFVVGWFLGKRK